MFARARRVCVCVSYFMYMIYSWVSLCGCVCVCVAQVSEQQASNLTAERPRKLSLDNVYTLASCVYVYEGVCVCVCCCCCYKVVKQQGSSHPVKHPKKRIIFFGKEGLICYSPQPAGSAKRAYAHSA